MSSVPQVPPSHEPQARPKVMRRPAQFSRKAETTDTPLVTAAAPNVTTPTYTAPRPAAPSVRSWQEDGKFGIAAILCVAVFNLILALTLPQIARETTSGPSTVTLMNNAAMPSAMRRNHNSSVTVYSEPEQSDDDNSNMDLNSLPEAHNDFSVSPTDIPAPTARALDQ